MTTGNASNMMLSPPTMHGSFLNIRKLTTKKNVNKPTVLFQLSKFVFKTLSCRGEGASSRMGVHCETVDPDEANRDSYMCTYYGISVPLT